MGLRRQHVTLRVVPGFDDRCDGSLKAGTIRLIDQREHVQCSICGKLLEPGYARLVPAHELDNKPGPLRRPVTDNIDDSFATLGGGSPQLVCERWPH